MIQDPSSFFKNTVLVRESSRLSLDPRDKGNFYNGLLIGSKYGVTGAALAAYRKRSVTLVDMRELTADEAVAIGLSAYYHVHGLDLLPWDVVVASVVDLSYNAGPGRAAEILQRLIGVKDDGNIGPITRNAYIKWFALLGPENAMKNWTATRIAFYKSLNNSTYINGWINRSNSFLPRTSWWKANA